MQNNSINFKDVWKPPFKYDGWGYIWSSENVMTFTFDDIGDTEDEYKKINTIAKNFVNVLNGDDYEKMEGLTVKNGCDIYLSDKCLGYFRGWGHLCGNTLRLKPEDAAKIQDEFINDFISKISKDATV